MGKARDAMDEFAGVICRYARGGSITNHKPARVQVTANVGRYVQGRGNEYKVTARILGVEEGSRVPNEGVIDAFYDMEDSSVSEPDSEIVPQKIGELQGRVRLFDSGLVSLIEKEPNGTPILVVGSKEVVERYSAEHPQVN